MAYLTGKRLRRRRSRSGGKRLSLPAIIGICTGSAILLAVLLGNLLLLVLDEEALQKLTGAPVEDPVADAAPLRTVPPVQAYPFALGSSTSSLTASGAVPPSALSVMLNSSDGTLTYYSAVSKYQGLTGNDHVALTSSMEKLWQVVPYISGAYHPQAFKTAGEDLFYAATLAEGALLREFVHAGASEILLLDLPFDSDNLNRTMSYIKQIKELLGSTPVGVAVPLSVAMSAEGWEILPALRECADYLAIDLREASEEELEPSLLNANYYIIQHQMRLVLDDGQTAYISAAEITVSDFQIVKADTKQEN